MAKYSKLILMIDINDKSVPLPTDIEQEILTFDIFYKDNSKACFGQIQSGLKVFCKTSGTSNATS